MGTALTVILVAVGIVIAVAVTIAVVKRFIFVVQQGTVLVVKRLGKHHDVYESGPHFRLPFIDTKHRTFDSQRRALSLELQGDSGGRLPVEMSVDLELEGVIDRSTVLDLAYRISDPMQHLRGVAVAEVRQLLLPMAFDQIMADADLANRIADKLKDVADECGYKIITARITSIRPERTVQAAIVEGERNQHVRADQAAEAEHDAAMRLKRARAAAAASTIEVQADRDRLNSQTSQVIELLATIVAAGTTKENAAAILTALLYQQTVMAASTNSKAQVILTPTGVTIPDDISALTTPKLVDASPAHVE